MKKYKAVSATVWIPELKHLNKGQSSMEKEIEGSTI